MNDLLRLFWRDCHRFWPLALGANLIAVILAFFPQLGLGSDTMALLSATGFVRLAIVVLLMIAVAQEDLVVTDRAAWLTRPISAASVFGAKLLFLVLLVAIPLGIISSLGAAQLDLGWRECAAVGAQYAALALFEGMIYLVLGAISVSVLAAIVVLVIGVAAVALLQPYRGIIFSPDGAIGPSSVLSTLLAAGVLIAALSYHYRQRQIRRTLPVLAAAVPLILWIGSVSQNEPKVVGTEPAISLVAKDGRGFVGAALRRPFPLSDRAIVGLEVVLPRERTEDYFLSSRTVKYSSFGHAPFEQRTSSLSIPPSIPTTVNDSVYTYWKQYPRLAQRIFGIQLAVEESDPLLPVVALTSGAMRSLTGSTGTLEASIAVSHEVIGAQGTLLREPGATAINAGYQLTIESVRFAGDSMKLEYRSTQLARRPSRGLVILALVNAEKGEVSFPEVDGGSYAFGFLLLDATTSCNFAHRWKIGSGGVIDGLGSDWLRAAELRYFVLRTEPAGLVELTVPEFAMPRIGGIQ